MTSLQEMKPRFPGLTETDMEAARQLIHLSKSSGGGDSAASSTQSIGTRPPPLGTLEEVEDEETGPWRQEKRYRLLSEVYAVTSKTSCSRGRKRRWMDV